MEKRILCIGQIDKHGLINGYLQFKSESLQLFVRKVRYYLGS